MARRPAEVFHPGSYVREEMEARGWSNVAAAQACGVSVALIDEIVAEKRRVTELYALLLEQGFGVSAQTWVNLQAAYDRGAA